MFRLIVKGVRFNFLTPFTIIIYLLQDTFITFIKYIREKQLVK